MRYLSWLRKWADAQLITPLARSRKLKTRLIPFFQPHLEMMESRCIPSAGQLDPTFGKGGTITTDIGGPTNDYAYAIATQSDGKVLVLGASGDVTGGQIALVRYNSNGVQDTSFGKNGQVTFNFVDSPSRSDFASALAVDGSGHIIVAGSTTSPSLPSKVFALAELNPNGSFNTAFGNGGTAIFATSAYTYDATAASLTSDAAGHILLAGSFSTDDPSVGFNHFSTVIRFNSDGSPDASFGQNGEANFNFGPNDSGSATSVAIDASGRVVVGGNAWNPTTFGTFAVARLNTDGSLDPSFGLGAKAIISLGPNTQSSVTGMALDSAGRIVLAGTEYPTVSPFTESFVVTRLKTDGSIDTGFGTGGVTTIGNWIEGVAVDSSGRIVLADYAYYNIPRSGYANAIAVNCLNSDGTTDTSFGTGGQGIIVPVAGFNQLVGVAVDPSGRIVVAGSTDSSPTGSDLLVVRFDSSGNPDSSWGAAGQVTTNIIGPSNDVPVGLTITQSDGKMLVVGTTAAAAGPGGVGLTRYNPDGSLDSTFGQGGEATIGVISGFTMSPTAAIVDGSGRIIVVGQSYGTSTQFGVLRLNSNGLIDTSFGTGGLATVVIGIESTASGVAIDASGRLVVVGTTFNSSGDIAAVARLNSDGSLDTTFGTSGVSLISVGSGSVTVAGVAVDGSGRIVVAGSSQVSPNTIFTQFALARLEPDGSSDGTFGAGGETFLTFGSGPGEVDTVGGLLLDSAGNIIVGGTTTPDTYGYDGSLALARLKAADGSLDQNFGNGGKVTVGNLSPDGYSMAAAQLAMDSAGHFALAGTLYIGGRYPGAPTELAVAEFNSVGVPDVDFGISGKALTNASSFIAAGTAFDRAGHLIIAGTQPSTQTGDDFAITRLLGRDLTLEAGSKTFAKDLHTAVTNLGIMQPPLTPRLVIHVSSPSQMAGVSAAIANVTVNPSGQTIEMILEVDAGNYNLGKVTVPAGLQLIIDAGGSKSFGTFASNTHPAMTLISGDVIIAMACRSQAVAASQPLRLRADISFCAAARSHKLPRRAIRWGSLSPAARSTWERIFRTTWARTRSA